MSYQFQSLIIEDYIVEYIEEIQKYYQETYPELDFVCLK